MARPTKYRPEYSNIAAELCLEGYSASRLAEVLRVAPSTIFKWKAEHPEFSNAMDAHNSSPPESTLENIARAQVPAQERIFDESKVEGNRGTPKEPLREPVRPHEGAKPGTWTIARPWETKRQTSALDD